jgi:transposase
MSRLEKEIKGILAKEFSDRYKLLKTIPGIGIKMNAIIISVLSGFEDFSNAKKVTSFLGICPKESGSSVKGKGSISKKGNSYIRKTLFMCTLSAIRFNKPCRDLYERLKAKGKVWKQIAIAVANKLIRQAFGVLRSGLAFDADFVEKNFNGGAKNA